MARTEKAEVRICTDGTLARARLFERLLNDLTALSVDTWDASRGFLSILT